MDKALMRLLVLHESELRAAAKLLRQAEQAQGTEQFTDAVHDALNACIVALYGLHDADNYSIVMVSSTKELMGRMEVEESPK